MILKKTEKKLLMFQKFRSNMPKLTITMEKDNLKKLTNLSGELKTSRGKTVEKLINNFHKFKEYDAS